MNARKEPLEVTQTQVTIKSNSQNFLFVFSLISFSAFFRSSCLKLLEGREVD